MGASGGGAGRQSDLEPKRKRACASVGVEGKRPLLGGKSVRTPWSRKHSCAEILTVWGKEVGLLVVGLRDADMCMSQGE